MKIRQMLEKGFNLNPEIKQLQQAKENAKNMEVTDTDAYREYSKLLFKRINELLEINKQTVEIVNSLDDVVLRSIFIARYVNFKTWEEIADEFEIDLRWVYRLHKKGLEELEKKLMKS